jgi:hypothetical protein
MLASSAGALSFTCAEKELPQPQREPLLPDAPRPVEQDRSGEPTGIDAAPEAVAKRVMAVKGDERHERCRNGIEKHGAAIASGPNGLAGRPPNLDVRLRTRVHLRDDWAAD